MSLHNAGFTFVLGLALGRGMEIFKPEVTRWLNRHLAWYRRLGDRPPVRKTFTIAEVSNGSSYTLETDSVSGAPVQTEPPKPREESQLTLTTAGQAFLQTGMEISFMTTERNRWGQFCDAVGRRRWRMGVRLRHWRRRLGTWLTSC